MLGRQRRDTVFGSHQRGQAPDFQFELLTSQRNRIRAEDALSLCLPVLQPKLRSIRALLQKTANVRKLLQRDVAWKIKTARFKHLKTRSDVSEK